MHNALRASQWLVPTVSAFGRCRTRTRDQPAAAPHTDYGRGDPVGRPPFIRPTMSTRATSPHGTPEGRPIVIGAPHHGPTPCRGEALPRPPLTSPSRVSSRMMNSTGAPMARSYGASLSSTCVGAMGLRALGHEAGSRVEGLRARGGWRASQWRAPVLFAKIGVRCRGVSLRRPFFAPTRLAVEPSRCLARHAHSLAVFQAAC